MSFLYRAYQLTIESDLPIPELVPLPTDKGESPEPDVYIRLDDVPKTLDNPAGQGVLYQARPNQFLLKLDGVARYLVQHGNEIVVQPVPASLDSDVRVFLLGSCFGALLHQRGLLVLHASGICVHNRAVIFTGRSGAGKSTLLGELLNRGHRMMADDVCAVVQDDDGTLVVLPAYPRTRLWADAAQKLEIDTGGMERTRPALEKYERQIPEQFWDRPAPLQRIYHLTSTNKDEIELDPLPRIPAFRSILHNTYRQLFLDGLEMRQPHFRLVSAVASKVGVTTVVRPSGAFRLAELADRIEADLGLP